MTLDEIEKLARNVVVKYGRDADKPSVHLSNAVLLLTPVARDALALYERAEKCHDRPWMGCAMDHSSIESALYDSAEAMRAALAKETT